MKPGRNDPCSCGSGKKYKHCCDGKVQAQPAAPSPAELNHLGSLYSAGRYAELEDPAHLLTERFPGSGFAWKFLGEALLRQGKDALSAYQKAAQLLPNDAESHYNLGVILKNLGLLDEAAASYRRAIKIQPNYVEAYINLGSTLKSLGRLDEAATSYRQALKLKPSFAEVHSNLGNVLKDLSQFSEAIASHRRALVIKPDYAEAHYNLGNALKEVGQLDEAAASYRRALKIQPDFAEAYSNLLFSMNYSAHHSPADCLAEAKLYGRMVAGKVTSRFSSWQCEANPKRLRVGLVSGDLRTHPVGYFMENLLAQIDPTRVELIAYPTQRGEDALTARIKPYFSAWHSLVGLSDQSAAQLIHADGVHVLIDLAGHTANNRLPVSAWKPAPVQAMWLGYFATTGVAEMDYILGDKWTLPDQEAHHFVEKGWRLLVASSCLTPPKEVIKVEPLPALHNQSITFGTLNNPTKMNDRVVACWAKILSAIPNSRLYLNTQNLRDNALKKIIIERYAAQGIAENRLILEATTGRAAALNSYNKVDIALDPFPYPGGTTSYEALWMGVPVLTMKGSNYISHLGESILHNAGLPDWIAADEADYVAKAVLFASDLPRLAALRAGLRQQVLVSPLFDAPRFARDFEDALWGMWQNHRTNKDSLQ